MRKIKPPIIILSPGRSGSTLIQRILNTSDEVIIWGEHDGFLKGLSESFRKVTTGKPINNFYYDNINSINSNLIKKSYTKYDISINWLNSFDKQSVKEEYRRFIFSLLNHDVNIRNKSWGFKEIKYFRNDEVVDMLVDLFPASKFIFSVRNPTDVILSKMFSFYSKEQRTIAFKENNFDALRAEIHRFAHGTNASLTSIIHWIETMDIEYTIVRFEDLIDNKSNSVKELFNFIEKPVPKNALTPFDFKLENTSKNPLHSEMKALITEEIPALKSIFKDSAPWFNYDF